MTWGMISSGSVVPNTSSRALSAGRSPRLAFSNTSSAAITSVSSPSKSPRLISSAASGSTSTSNRSPWDSRRAVTASSSGIIRYGSPRRLKEVLDSGVSTTPRTKRRPSNHAFSRTAAPPPTGGLLLLRRELDQRQVPVQHAVVVGWVPDYFGDLVILVELRADRFAVLVARTLRVRARPVETGLAPGVGVLRGDVGLHPDRFDLDGRDAGVVDA